jgi:hypothetical protein
LHRRSEILGAIDRRLWRDLGLDDPEPAILPFLPMIVVAWADGTLGSAEADRVRDRASKLPARLRKWVEARLSLPPGPYFRYQVQHLVAFMLCTWCQGGSRATWAEEGREWAAELIHEAGWFKRAFGRVAAEVRDLDELEEAVGEGRIFAGDRLWALSRGAGAEAEPRRVVATLPDDGQVHQALGLVFEGEGERIAVASVQTLLRDEDLDARRVAALLNRSAHLGQSERWVYLAEELAGVVRPITTRQRGELSELLHAAAGGPVEEVAPAEMAYLEDALAADARWVSWVAGAIEELRISHGEVVRHQVPGTFYAPRDLLSVAAHQEPVKGPPGLTFRVLAIEGGGQSLRLATPVLSKEPATKEAAQWIGRFLPSMCSPWTQLVLDVDGPRWIAEVLPEIATAPTTRLEPLLPGRALLVPPWTWARAAAALGADKPRKAGRPRTSEPSAKAPAPR